MYEGSRKADLPNEGVKNTLIYRKAKPACPKFNIEPSKLYCFGLTGISMIWTITLVFLSPSRVSLKIKAKKRTISRATEAGNETELRPMILLTPQQANSTQRMPLGTYNQAVSVRRQASCHACESVNPISVA